MVSYYENALFRHINNILYVQLIIKRQAEELYSVRDLENILNIYRRPQ